MHILKQFRNEAGQRHCVDGPAIVYSDGSRHWWVNGKRHREDGPASECTNGEQEWWLNGLPHRVGGPAFIWNGPAPASKSLQWYVEGERHRIDGPAVIKADGTQRWYIRNKDSTLEVRSWIYENNISSDYLTWTDLHRTMFRMRF